jgi:DNA-binding CsgD family transcriptional regulator
MFELAFRSIVPFQASGQDRQDGLAFLKSAAALYRLEAIGYLGFNIPNRSRGTHFVHLMCSDTCLLKSVTPSHFKIDRSSAQKVSNARDGLADFLDKDCLELPGHVKQVRESRSILITPRFSQSERAIMGLRLSEEQSDVLTLDDAVIREWAILANYFHSHMMRINGNDADQDLIVSARELDCLKWTAAGKTAWEASVILGISERTVRFHLNAAREKMNCATTAQAVAKAVSRNMISI